MNRRTEEKGYLYWQWLQHRLERGAQAAGVAYLADATDAHVQGVSGAPSPIQDFGCQLHHQVLSPGLTPERAGGGRVVVLWEPFIITSLVLNIIVGWTLLGSEVLCIWRAVLSQRKRFHRHITRWAGPAQAEQESHESRPPHLFLSRSHFIPLFFFFF